MASFCCALSIVLATVGVVILTVYLTVWETGLIKAVGKSDVYDKQDSFQDAPFD